MNISGFMTLIILAILMMLVIVRVDLVTDTLSSAGVNEGNFFIGGIMLLTMFVVMAFAVTRK